MLLDVRKQMAIRTCGVYIEAGEVDDIASGLGLVFAQKLFSIQEWLQYFRVTGLLF